MNIGQKAGAFRLVPSSKRPRADRSSISSLAVRTYDYNSAKVLESAGATATYLPFNEALTKVRAGALNAILSSGDGGAGRKLWDDLPNFSGINYSTPISIAMVRTADLAALPEDVQKIVQGAASETERRQLALLADRQRANYGQMRQNGVSIEATAPDDVMSVLQAAARSTAASWREKATPQARGVLDAFQNDTHE